MDALSAALGSVRMTGAIFYDVVCGSPWGFRVPATHDAAPLLAPGTHRLVNYHLVTEGRALVHLEDPAEELEAVAGDVVVLPHGDPHAVRQGEPVELVDSQIPLEEAVSGRPSTVRLGGTGAITRIVCGFLGCERHADHLFLAGLPRVFTVSLRSDDAGGWLERTIVHLVDEAQQQAPGSPVLLTKMAEVLFIEILRRHMATLPPEHVGWLAGARDEIVGHALALMHRHPDHAWTVAELAARAGASRSVLAERFSRIVGEAPLSYLSRWRIQLGARLLESTQKTVLEIAVACGYQSESAFNRAFKREFGAPPARYRSRCRGDAEA